MNKPITIDDVMIAGLLTLLAAMLWFDIAKPIYEFLR
jgi:hypothetical protein